MKGTLYTADFINTPYGVRLLEFNTDTGFTDSLVSYIDFEPLLNVLNDNQLSTIHVIYKPSIQKNFVDSLVSYLNINASNIVVETTEEQEYTIYPTDVPDSDDKFILRLAYNESAIFDSEYCKENIKLYRLMLPDSGSDISDSGVVPFYYSSSADFAEDSYLKNHINTDTACPDLIVKYDGSDPSLNDKPGFYKLGHSSASIEERISDFINEMKADYVTITNYFDTSENTNYMKSIRVCNILYGSNLDNINLLTKKVDALFDKPKINEDFTPDDSNLYTKYHLRHLFELATNHIKFDYSTQEGVGSDVVLLSGSEQIQVESANEGDVFKALHIPGLPDTDNYDELFSWSLDGNALPAETYVTESVLVNKVKTGVEFGILQEIVIDSGSFLAGPGLPLLVHEGSTNRIVYKKVRDVVPTQDNLFNASGSLVSLLENNIFVLPEDGYSYSLNFEENDTFLINETGVRIVTHNIRYEAVGVGFYGCFVAGTKITLADGSTKNIEECVVGDSVLSFNEETGKNEAGTVGEIKSHNVSKIVRLTLDNEIVILTTPEHPFAFQEGWRNAGELQPLDECKKEDGSTAIVSTVEILDEETLVYNLHDVSDNHNFYANGILVHNKV